MTRFVLFFLWALLPSAITIDNGICYVGLCECKLAALQMDQV